MNSLGERHIIDCFYSCAKESFLKYRKFPCKWNIGLRELKTQAHRKWSNSDTLTLEIEINITFQEHTLENYPKTVDHYDVVRCSNTQIFWIFHQNPYNFYEDCFMMFDICPMLVEKIPDTTSKGEFDHRQFLALGLSWKAGPRLKEQRVRIFDRS